MLHSHQMAWSCNEKKNKQKLLRTLITKSENDLNFDTRSWSKSYHQSTESILQRNNFRVKLYKSLCQQGKSRRTKNNAIYQNRAHRLPGRESSISNNKVKTLGQKQSWKSSFDFQKIKSHTFWKITSNIHKCHWDRSNSLKKTHTKSIMSGAKVVKTYTEVID